MKGFRLAVEMLAYEKVRALTGVTFPVKFTDRLRQLNQRNTANAIKSTAIAWLIDLRAGAGRAGVRDAGRPQGRSRGAGRGRRGARRAHPRRTSPACSIPSAPAAWAPPTDRDAVVDRSGRVRGFDGLARGRRLDHADGAARQHQHPDHHDRGEDFGRDCLGAVRRPTSKLASRSDERHERLQQDRLRRTLRAVTAAHPFYRARFRALGIVAGDIRSLDDLQNDCRRPEGRLHRRSGGVPAARRRSAGGFRAGRARAVGCRLHDRDHQRQAVAVLQHHARRLRDLGPGAALQRGRGHAGRRPRRQPLSAGGLSDRRVPQRDPLDHDRRPAGGARAHRLGALRVQGAQFARRGARQGRSDSARPCCGACRASCGASSTRRGAADAISPRRAAGHHLGRAGAAGAARGDARSCSPGCGAAAVADPRALRLHRDAGRAGAMRRAMPRRRTSRPTSTISKWSIPTAAAACRTARAACSPSPTCTAAARCCCAIWSATSSRCRARRARICGRIGERVVATPRRTGNLVKCRGMLVNTDVVVDLLSAMPGHRPVPDRVRARGGPGAMDRMVIRIERRR